MIDWLSSMQQTFEYYIVDPGTWRDVKLLDTVKSSSISRELDTETLGSASFDVIDTFGECYVRVYLIAIQNGEKEKVPLGTFLIQTPSSTFDGKIRSVSLDAYTPLIELKEKLPPFGYSLLKTENRNILETAYLLTRENVRAPVVKAVDSKVLESNFVANTDDTWMTFLTDLLANAKYTFSLDEMGRILFSPKQDMASLQPVWTFDDSNSSILYPELALDHDLYGIPNVVEVVYSQGIGVQIIRAENRDDNSPLSIQNRGREIVYRITNPDILGTPTQLQLQEYADLSLKELSSVEYTVTYTHGYCPVRLGDCVRLNYSRAGLTDIKAKVISQSIKCAPGCQVTEKAVFTAKLWR